MRSEHLLLIVVLSVMTGCCMREMQFSTNAGISSTGTPIVGAETKFVFGDCLSDHEKTIVKDLKTSLAEQLDRFFSGEINQEEYNSYVDAVSRALREAILVTSVRPVGPTPPGFRDARAQTFTALRELADKRHVGR